jgi:hypothetical protein
MSITSFQPPPTYALPVVVDELTGKSVFNPIWLRWFIDLSSNLGSGGAGSGSVTSITAGTGLTGGTITTSGTIALGLVPTANLQGLTATITTAKLTAGGTNGSMTFTKGLLTAQTPAT